VAHAATGDGDRDLARTRRRVEIRALERDVLANHQPAMRCDAHFGEPPSRFASSGALTSTPEAAYSRITVLQYRFSAYCAAGFGAALICIN
jgi:hypothetical protein